MSNEKINIKSIKLFTEDRSNVSGLFFYLRSVNIQTSAGIEKLSLRTPRTMAIPK